MFDFISLYRVGVATYATLASLVIGAIVATWERLTDEYLLGYYYDAGHHDLSIFLLVFGLLVSIPVAMWADDYADYL